MAQCECYVHPHNGEEQQCEACRKAKEAAARKEASRQAALAIGYVITMLLRYDPSLRVTSMRDDKGSFRVRASTKDDIHTERMYTDIELSSRIEAERWARSEAQNMIAHTMELRFSLNEKV